MQLDERMNDPQLAARAANDGLQSRLWTAMPGIVDAYDADTQTATIQGAVQPQQLDPATGKWKSVTLPLFGKVPVVWAGGGGYALTFPLAKGDEGLVVFGKNCIDAWWQQGGIQPQIEVRQHDLSDAMFIPGLRSQPRRMTPPPSTTKVQLRSGDGATRVEIEPGFDDNGIVSIVAPGGIKLIGPLMINDIAVTNLSPGVISFAGEVQAEGNVIAGTAGSSVTLLAHRHPANNTPPIPGT